MTASSALAGAATAELERLLDGYADSVGGHDELMEPGGRIRPAWRSFLDGFTALGEHGRAGAADATKRSLRESGIAFNVYADPDDRAHAWRLDLLPVLIAEGEWARLSEGLAQRARLLDAVLVELYGERRLLHEGRLPPGLVLAGDDYARPCVGSPAEARLVTYACDIARTADGGWVVLADQADTAVGNGYVLAGRVALSHGLADLFTDSHARRLASYYLRHQEALQAIVGRDDGRVVMLSPGPDAPSYFSHAYLARYLGYTLVEAADLTVRDSQVFVKTLDGLQRVDVVARKLPSRGIDPLQLPAPGVMGVPGLVQAARAGRVTVANALGNGVVQHRVLAPFAAELCKALLGEELRIADAPAIWLGSDAGRAEAVQRLAELEFGPLTARNDPGDVAGRIVGASLAGAARARFLERLPRDGVRMIAQEPVSLATTPAYEGGDRIRPAPYAIRCFLTRTGDGGFSVLPGGLVRMAGSAQTTVLPNGHGSKDLWVTAARPEAQVVSILRGSMREVHLRRTGRDLLSRTADNLFWLGRYAERAEMTMRLLRSVLTRALEDRAPEVDPALLRRVLAVEMERGGELPVLPSDDRNALEDVVTLHMYEPSRPYGLRDSLASVNRTATRVRDQISHDAWRMLNALHTDPRWRKPPRPLRAGQALDLLDDGIRRLNAFAGTEAENMTRNFAWRFLEMGRRVQRASSLVGLVRELLDPADVAEPGHDLLRLLLELGDSFMTYRSRYVMTPLLAPVLDLLLLDESNPRALAFQLKELDAHLALLPGAGPHRSVEQRLVLRLLTEVRLTQLDALTEDGRGLSALSGLLQRMATGLPELSALITTNHFAHAEAPMTTFATLATEEA